MAIVENHCRFPLAGVSNISPSAKIPSQHIWVLFTLLTLWGSASWPWHLFCCQFHCPK